MEFLLIVVGQQLNSYRSFNCLVGHAQIAALSLLLQLNLSDSFTFEMVAPKFQCGTFLFVCGHKMCIRSVENHNILLFVQLSFAPFWNYKWFATHIYMYIYMSCKHCILFRAHQTQASDFTKLLHRQSKQTKNITYCTRWENAMPTQCHCMQEAKRAKLMGFLPLFTYATMPFVCVDNHGKYHSKYWCNTAKSIITLQYILSLRKNSFSSANKTKQLYNKEADLNSKKKNKIKQMKRLTNVVCVCVWNCSA